MRAMDPLAGCWQEGLCPGLRPRQGYSRRRYNAHAHNNTDTQYKKYTCLSPLDAGRTPGAPAVTRHTTLMLTHARVEIEVHWVDIATLGLFKFYRAFCIGMKYAYFSDSELACVRGSEQYSVYGKMGRSLGNAAYYDQQGATGGATGWPSCLAAPLRRGF